MLTGKGLEYFFLSADYVLDFASYTFLFPNLGT